MSDIREAFEIVDRELRQNIPSGGSQVVRAWGRIKSALQQTAHAVPEGVRQALECFEIARFEGWDTALEEGNSPVLRDIYDRRISWAEKYLKEIQPDHSPDAGKVVPDSEFSDEFAKWWKDHGQFVRAGGGNYERTFAFEAWRHLYPRITAPAADGGEVVPVGWVKWYNGEIQFVELDGILPQDAKTHGWRAVAIAHPAQPRNDSPRECRHCGEAPQSMHSHDNPKLPIIYWCECSSMKHMDYLKIDDWNKYNNPELSWGQPRNEVQAEALEELAEEAEEAAEAARQIEDWAAYRRVCQVGSEARKKAARLRSNGGDAS